MTWPFENDTSAITKKLAQRSFKANKLRNIVAVIAIVLTSMLFTSVTTLCVGAIQSIQTTILQIRGTSPSTGTSVNWIAHVHAVPSRDAHPVRHGRRVKVGARGRGAGSGIVVTVYDGSRRPAAQHPVGAGFVVGVLLDDLVGPLGTSGRQ